MNECAVEGERKKEVDQTTLGFFASVVSQAGNHLGVAWRRKKANCCSFLFCGRSKQRDDELMFFFVSCRGDGSSCNER